MNKSEAGLTADEIRLRIYNRIALANRLRVIADTLESRMEDSLKMSAWRLADAGGQLTDMIKAEQTDRREVMGIDYPTGAGWQIVAR